MKKSVNPWFAAIILLVVVVVAFYVMYQKSNLPPPIAAGEAREMRSGQYEAEMSRYHRDTQPPSEAPPESPASEAQEDGE